MELEDVYSTDDPLSMSEIKECCYNLEEAHLPSNYKHRVLESTGEGENAEYVIRANLKTMIDIDAWIHEFSCNSKTQWNVRKTHPNGPQKIWKEMVCHHSSFMKVDKNKNKRGSSKNEACQAKIRLTIQVLSRSNRKTEFMKTNLWATIRISKNHTHSLYSPQTLRLLQDKDDYTRLMFHEYFMDNMGVAEARHYHQRLLELKKVPSEELANGRVNPVGDTVSHWYKQWRNLNIPPRTESQLISKLEEKKNNHTEKGVIIAYEEETLCVCIVTPIMQRAHALPSAKELVIIDTTNWTDPGRHSISFLLTPCPTGIIPLGLLITKGQTTEAYSNGFKLFQKTTSSFAFGNQGYPTTILTNDSLIETEAIRETWPKSTQFLNVFNVLQTVWRWLYNSDNKIQQGDRTMLMAHFKNILKAENVDLMIMAYNACIENGSTYPQWIKYVDEYWEYQGKWCLAYRDEIVRSHHMNNYSEANTRILKDIVLSKVKPHQVVSFVDFCAIGLEEYLVSQLKDFANFRNRRSYSFFRRRLKKIEYLTANDIISNSDHEFVLPNKSHAHIMHTVDCDIGVCSCFEGRFGRFCDHQCAVFQFYELSVINFPSITTNDRYMMAKLAFGRGKMPDVSFYDSFIMEIDPNEEVKHSIDAIETSIVRFNNDDDVHFVNDNFDNDNMEASQLMNENEELTNDILRTLKQKINNCKCSVELVNALYHFKERLCSVKTVEALLELLHPKISKRSESEVKIGVQSASSNSRKSNITEGYRKITSGRISKENVNYKFRKILPKIET